MRNQLSKKFNKLQLATNPLKNLTNSDIENLISSSKLGNDVRLQQCFKEMEKIMPVFGICKDRRISQIINRGWSIVPVIENDNSLETSRQKNNLTNLLKFSEFNNGTSLTDAIKHLALYAFRGRAAVKPVFDKENKCLKFILLDNANILKDPIGNVYWNDDNWGADFSKLTQLSDKEIAIVTTESSIDYPGLLIYLRQTVGELQWSRMVEKQGVPQVVITAPDGTTDGQFAQYTQRAMALFEGGSGVLPAGSSINVLDSARSADPFTPFLSHQQELICILALGSTASVFPQNSGLGSDLNSVQGKILNDLVSTDCRLIQNSLSKIFKERFGFDRVRFQFNSLKNYTIDEVLNIAKAIKDLGLEIDPKKVREQLDLDLFVDNDKPVDTEWTPGEETND